MRAPERLHRLALHVRDLGARSSSSIMTVLIRTAFAELSNRLGPK